MLEGMFDGELARYVSHGSNLGLGEMLYKEITGEEMPRQSASGAARPKYAAPEVRVTVPPVTAPRPAAVLPAVPVVKHALSPSADGAVAAAPAESSPAVRATAAGVPAVREQTLPAAAQKESPKEPQITVPAAVTAPSDTVRRRLEVLGPIIKTAADTTGVNASLLKAVIATESGGRAQAKSPRNAKGLMQLIDSTATAMGVRNVWDPLQNVQGGARYLSQMMDRFGGNIEHALASYNAGPGAVEKHKGIPPYRETQMYVGKVLEYLRYFEQQEAGSDDQD
jgi:soluble lytic murein transglycosylase-like protein